MQGRQPLQTYNELLFADMELTRLPGSLFRYSVTVSLKHDGSDDGPLA